MMKDKCKTIEPIYGSRYHYSDIDTDIKMAYKNPKVDPSPNNLKLDLPPINKFMPNNLNIIEASCDEMKTEYPTTILQTE